MTRTQQLAQWNDPKSVSFRATVKGWAFKDESTLGPVYTRAIQFAWLPEHHDTLTAIRETIARSGGTIPATTPQTGL